MPPRCFLALTLPGSVIEALVSSRETFLAGAPAWAGEKWVATPALHMTIAFLGAVDDEALQAAVPRLGAAVASVGAFDLRLSRIVAVPSPRKATMLWATLGDPDGRLAALRDALMTAFPDVAVESGRPLRPHVTLVRTRSPRRAEAAALAAASALVEAMGKEPDGVVSVHSATLFSSTLRPTGPEYRAITVAHLAP